MNELKCKECGALLAQDAKECPSCGYPIEKVGVAPDKVQTAMKFNVMSVISLFLGVVIIIMGISVMNEKVNIDTYSAEHYDADHAEFGGDFYTEIYGACDIIVDELNGINGGVEVLSKSMAAMANVIYYPIGMLIVSLGLGVIATSCNHIKKANT